MANFSSARAKPDGPRSDSRRHRVGLSVGSSASDMCLAAHAVHLCASRPLVSGRCCWQVAPGLGPPRPAQHELRLAVQFTQTVARDIRRRGRSPKNGVAERFPDWTAVGFRADDRRPARGAMHGTVALTLRSPGPCFLGSRALHRSSRAALARWVRRTADRGTLSPRGGESTSLLICRHSCEARCRGTEPKHERRPIRTTHSRCCVTCGDSNPTCLTSPFELISFG